MTALPFGYADLEPHIDEMTMKIHHDKHHQAYVTNVNKALEGKAMPGLGELVFCIIITNSCHG
jgi:superoxide dismutase